MALQLNNAASNSYDPDSQVIVEKCQMQKSNQTTDYSPELYTTPNQPTSISQNCTKPDTVNCEKDKYCKSSKLQVVPPNATTSTARHPKHRFCINALTNSSMPSIHGGAGPSNTVTEYCHQKQKLSAHQRNMSLDFRSMGIALPSIPQTATTRINSTQHHRNRSLDSALQRIPEVETSPNAENENALCTNSILTPICSPVLTSPSTHLQSVTDLPIIVSDRVTDPSQNTTPVGDKTLGKVVANTKISGSKKREDLTSLGSDDSGIICGSESEQSSLFRIHRSHESLDSAEVDPEEECMDMLGTTSMDEEYKIIRSDLHLDQTHEDNIKTFSYLTNSNNNDSQTSVKNSTLTCELPLNNTCNNIASVTSRKAITPTNDTTSGLAQKNDSREAKQADETIKPSEGSTKTTPVKPETEVNKLEQAKNEVLFRNFFGATKNALFRTAQSIIDSHDKKNLTKKSDESETVKTPSETSKKKDFFVLKSSSNKSNKASIPVEPVSIEREVRPITASSSSSSLNKIKVPGVVKCFVKEKEDTSSLGKGSSGGLLRFFESPVFNIHFAIHYLFYSKEPGVLSFIGNKIFSFADTDVNLYIPQLIVMYIQMDELADVLDPYLTYRCRKSVDFSLKCLWLLEAYNYQIDRSPSLLNISNKRNLSLMKELYSKKDRKQLKTCDMEPLSPIKKTHYRSQSDATVLLIDSRRFPSAGSLELKPKTFLSNSAKLCLGDLSSGKAFDNGCICFETVRGAVNGLLGQKIVCSCGAPKLEPQKEFMRALINIGRNLTCLQTKTEKTSALRMFLNLINKNLPARVWLPLHSDIPHHIVRITEEKTAVLNSKDKTPYIIYVEVVDINDIYSSPVIMKMMPSLRHTKSEENLEFKKDNALKSENSLLNLQSESKVAEFETESGGGDCSSCNNQTCQASQHIENKSDVSALHFTEDDVWSQEDDEITAQYMNLHKLGERDSISQISLDSCDSRDQNTLMLFNIGDVRKRHCKNLTCENTKLFSNDPEDPSAAALKEPWHEKEKQIRASSPYGHLSNWRLLSAIVKCGDDLRQELMATQLLQMFKIIWQEENVDLWVRPYKIVCLSDDSGLIEPIPNTVSVHQIKKNSNKTLRDYFVGEYGYPDTDRFKSAQMNFVQSCAAYCLISYLLQVKDRHNGNILLHSDGHIIHIDFGFILSISPKNLGFEQSPFKLTAEFVEVMGGTASDLWVVFNHLLLKGLMAARKHMDRIINLVEIMRSNAQLPCFKSGCSGTVQNLRKRFHMNLTEQELERKVEQLVQDSLKSLSTKLYDGYQYFTNGIL